MFFQIKVGKKYFEEKISMNQSFVLFCFFKLGEKPIEHPHFWKRMLKIRELEDFPGCTVDKGEGNDNPLQYSCLENHMNGGA